jgi:molecular chaperone DnaJ
MSQSNHYQTLEISPTASQREIKLAYRRLAKLFHPDSNQSTASHDKIASINAAYEILGDPQRRHSYDQQLRYTSRSRSVDFSSTRQHRQEQAAAAQARYRSEQRASRQADEQIEQWIRLVYTPVCRIIQQILSPLKRQIDDLAADPFDDDLMSDFQDYLDECRDLLGRAEKTFRSRPNPTVVAGIAANLYYCLGQVSDGLDQLEFFTANYDDHYLHTGQELFRIAAGLRREAQAAIKEFA